MFSFLNEKVYVFRAALPSISQHLISEEHSSTMISFDCKFAIISSVDFPE